MVFTKISSKELRSYAPQASDLYLETVVTYLEAGGLYPGKLGRKQDLYVYDASLDPEDYFGSYRTISFDDAVKEAEGTCECFVLHFQDKLGKTRTKSLAYAQCLQKLGRVKGDLIVLKTQRNLKEAG